MAYTDREDLNYLGQLFVAGQTRTPFLNMLGGIGRGKRTNSFGFPVSQTYSLDSPSQPAITEAASVTSQTATTKTLAQTTNTVQIFQETVEVSYAKQSTYQEISGISLANGEQPITDQFEFQKAAHLKQIAVDMDYTFLNGAYQAATDSTTAAKTRGVITAITTNAVAAGGADLTKALMDTMFASMAANGAVFENIVVMVNTFQKTALSNIYAYAPTDRNVGGVNINQIETDFGRVGILYEPNVPADTVAAIEMNAVEPVYCPVDGQLIKFDILAQTAASKKGQWYLQTGIDYGLETLHGKITGLATS